MQPVAIEMADQARRVQQRPRPTRRHPIDLLERVAAVFRVGRDHDGDVVIGQRRRPFDARNDVQRQQFDPRMP